MKIFKIITAVSFLIISGFCVDKSDVQSFGTNQNHIVNSEKSTKANALPILKKYQLKSGIITFESTSVAGTEKMIVYFDDYGIKERSETYAEDGKLKEIKFSDGEKMYKINFEYSDDKITYILGPGNFGTEMKFVAEPFTRQKDIEKYNYKKLSNMIVLGKDCEVYSTTNAMGESIFGGWGNLCLYSEAKTKYGNSKTIAVEIKENAAVDGSLFKVPSGYEVKSL